MEVQGVKDELHSTANSLQGATVRVPRLQCASENFMSDTLLSMRGKTDRVAQREGKRGKIWRDAKERLQGGAER